VQSGVGEGKGAPLISPRFVTSVGSVSSDEVEVGGDWPALVGVMVVGLPSAPVVVIVTPVLVSPDGGVVGVGSPSGPVVVVLGSLGVGSAPSPPVGEVGLPPSEDSVTVGSDSPGFVSPPVGVGPPSSAGLVRVGSLPAGVVIGVGSPSPAVVVGVGPPSAGVVGVGPPSVGVVGVVVGSCVREGLPAPGAVGVGSPSAVVVVADPVSPSRGVVGDKVGVGSPPSVVVTAVVVGLESSVVVVVVGLGLGWNPQICGW
jgi:hypothetical protein